MYDRMREELEIEFNSRYDYIHELYAADRRAMANEARMEEAYYAEQREIMDTIVTLAKYRLARRGIFIVVPSLKALYEAGAYVDFADDIPF